MGQKSQDIIEICDVGRRKRVKTRVPNNGRGSFFPNKQDTNELPKMEVEDIKVVQPSVPKKWGFILNNSRHVLLRSYRRA